MDYRDVLFWIFISFFILIGIVSLLALLGFFKHVDPGFRKWAVTGFVGAVTVVVVELFRLSFAPDIALFVTLKTAQDTQPPAQLVSGLYEYDELASGGKLVTRSGPLTDIVLDTGGWQVKLPQQVLDKPVRLTFKDGVGSQWTVLPFYPSHIPREFKTNTPHTTGQSDRALWPAWVPVVMAAEPTRLETVSSATQAQKTAPKFNNYSKSEGQKSGRPYYQWRVFVDEPPSVLDTIEQVEYVLHPTFPEPFQIANNRKSGFELVNEGWGEFTMLITIRYKDGTAVKTSYDLSLQKSWPVDAALSAAGNGNNQANVNVMEFIRIPPGEFMMGCSRSPGGCSPPEGPKHKIKITKAFEIGKYEATQGDWESIMQSNPSKFQGKDRPVEEVKWDDVHEFLTRLNARKDGYMYRLPTEAEWEYAARAGSVEPYAGRSVDDVAWYWINSGSKVLDKATLNEISRQGGIISDYYSKIRLTYAFQTHPVGRKRPNDWGLYDMLGNVSEWVQDWYDEGYYKSSPTVDPAGPPLGKERVVRSGNWDRTANVATVSYRRGLEPTKKSEEVGFRYVRETIR